MIEKPFKEICKPMKNYIKINKEKLSPRQVSNQDSLNMDIRSSMDFSSKKSNFRPMTQGPMMSQRTLEETTFSNRGFVPKPVFSNQTTRFIFSPNGSKISPRTKVESAFRDIIKNKVSN
jgi:hypothetical protein